MRVSYEVEPEGSIALRRWDPGRDVRRRAPAESVRLRAIGQIDPLAATLNEELVQRPVATAIENLLVVLLGVVAEPAMAEADPEPLDEASDRVG